MTDGRRTWEEISLVVSLCNQGCTSFNFQSLSKKRFALFGTPWNYCGSCGGLILSVLLVVPKNQPHTGVNRLFSDVIKIRRRRTINGPFRIVTGTRSAFGESGTMKGVFRLSYQAKSVQNLPQFMPIPEACRLLGLSRTELYRKLGTGTLRAKKIGRKTIVDIPHALEWLQSLPDAIITTK